MSRTRRSGPQGLRVSDLALSLYSSAVIPSLVCTVCFVLKPHQAFHQCQKPTQTFEVGAQIDGGTDAIANIIWTKQTRR